MTFRMPSYRVLKQELGEIDASSECLELAIREFVAASMGFSDISRFILQLSKRHGIRVNVNDLADFIQRASALRLIGVTQSFEAFLNNYISEHPRIKSRKGKHDGEILLDFVLRMLDLPKGEKRNFTSSIDYKLYNYYRKVRNVIVHRAADLPSIAVDDLEELQKCTKADTRYARLAAPNKVESLAFDDYVLFTRCAKNLASTLSEIGAFTKAEIVEWLERHRSRQGSPERQSNAIRTMLRSEFGIGSVDAEHYVQLIISSGQ